MRLKWLTLFLLCISTVCSFAGTWGVLKGYTRSKDGQAVTSHMGERYMLGKILQGKPLRVGFWVQGDEQGKHSDYYQDLLRDSYNQWFKQTARIIRSRGREEEFANVLPFLDKGVEIEFGDVSDERDMNVFVLSARSLFSACSGSAGCYTLTSDIIEMFLPQHDPLFKKMTDRSFDVEKVFLHEIGHSMGLSDQYEGGRANSHPVYSSQKSAKSAMNKAPKITCDDADGMINLIDLTLGISRGGEKGWRSLCRGRNEYYAYGQPVGNSPYSIHLLDSLIDWELEEVREAKSYKREFQMDLNGDYDPLKEIKETVLRADSSGRPVLARGENGEEIYYAYNYDQMLRMIVKNGKVLAVQSQNVLYDDKNSMKIKKVNLYFGSRGEGFLWTMERPLGLQGKKGIVGILPLTQNKAPAWFDVDRRGNRGPARSEKFVSQTENLKKKDKHLKKKQQDGGRSFEQIFDLMWQEQYQEYGAKLLQWYMLNL